MFYVNWQWKRADVRIPLVVDVLIWITQLLAAFW
ncbi:hypothetical protein T08_14076 [Trichinella sp. T8]|nr:hypothetical protein T08_14076 [Trichinella sp. T8]